jgi:hypothetical protein
MKRNILYYPTIDIPQNNWLRHALLYWDEVSSIIPENLDSRISPHIDYLIHEEEFRSIRPESFFRNEKHCDLWNDFEKDLYKIISSDEFQTKLKLDYPSGRYNIHENNTGIGNIYHSKTLDMLLLRLQRENLVKINNEDREWLLFEKNTALVYMSLLAKYLAEIDGEHTVIGTDNLEYEKMNFRRVNSNEGFPTLNLSLDYILPTPADNVPFEKIIDFKRKRKDNLLKFRRELKDFQEKLAHAKSNSELKDNVATFQESMKLELRDLAEVLKDSNIQVVYNSFKSLIDVKSPSMWLKAGTLVTLPVNWAALGIGVMSLIEVSGSFIEHRNKTRASLRDSSFSYIYQAQKDGIIQQFT